MAMLKTQEAQGFNVNAIKRNPIRTNRYIGVQIMYLESVDGGTQNRTLFAWFGYELGELQWGKIYG